MILLWGLQQDTPLSRVHVELRRRGTPVVLVDQREVLDSTVTLEGGAQVTGEIRVHGRRIDLSAVTAAYIRPYDSWRIGQVARSPEGGPDRRRAAEFDDALWVWADLTAARVVNRPRAMARTSSKPRQLAAIAAHGFRVPETVVTTDPAAVPAFRARHDAVVYKSISGIRSVVSRLTPDDDLRLADVAQCPTQFQEYVPGTDYRVHVVGDEVFCARIESAADDYRYSSRRGVEMTMAAACLPDDWPERCCALVAEIGLHLAGVDLRRTPDGSWFCFEVNPSPAFTYYDRFGQGIADAVARLLTADRIAEPTGDPP